MPQANEAGSCSRQRGQRWVWRYLWISGAVMTVVGSGMCGRAAVAVAVALDIYWH